MASTSMNSSALNRRPYQGLQGMYTLCKANLFCPVCSFLPYSSIFYPVDRSISSCSPDLLFRIVAPFLCSFGVGDPKLDLLGPVSFPWPTSLDHPFTASSL